MLITAADGLIPATYTPRHDTRTLIRLVLVAGMAAFGGAILSLSWGWASAVVGVVLLTHHAIWAMRTNDVMYLWPGISALGVGLLFGSVVVNRGSLLEQPVALIGVALVLFGSCATYFNLGASR